MVKYTQMKSSRVLLLGRPNVGKSTFINTLFGQKLAITSPRPQTTRFPIHAKFRDERGEITFIDTPGVFRKAKDALSKSINKRTLATFADEVDAVVYMMDPTREKDFEEARVLGLFRQMKTKKMVAFTKLDLGQKYLAQYSYIFDEVAEEDIFKISCLKGTHIPSLIDRLFEIAPEKSEIGFDQDGPMDEQDTTTPATNLDSKTWLAELVREKVFLNTRKEVPYATNVEVDEVVEKEDGMLVIKARIVTTNDTYKKMLIGARGRRVKAIGMAVRKELELATNKHVFIELLVEVDRHWVEKY